MRLTEGLDEGPVLASESLRIGPLDTAGTVHDRMAAIGADLLARTLPSNVAFDSLDFRENGLMMRFSVRGTPEETQRLDQIDGIILDICRRARDAAVAASAGGTWLAARAGNASPIRMSATARASSVGFTPASLARIATDT